MKKTQNEQMIVKTQVVFEMDNNGFGDSPDDPTTSLATSTLTHIFTLMDKPSFKKKEV
jgi:hypothetical protein